MNAVLLNVLYTVIGSVVTFVLSFLGYKLTQLIDSRIKNEKTAALLKAATNSVTAAVKAAKQTYVDDMKKSGTFDSEAQKAALELAMDTAKKHITGDAQSAVECTYGDFEKWLKTAIESIVSDIKTNNVK